MYSDLSIRNCFKFCQYILGSHISVSGPDLIDTPVASSLCNWSIDCAYLETDPLFCSLLLHSSSFAREEVLKLAPDQFVAVPG